MARREAERRHETPLRVTFTENAAEALDDWDASAKASVIKVLEVLEAQTWEAATRARKVKVLRAGRHVAEIRVMRGDSYRLIGFWYDDRNGRTLRICSIHKKKWLTPPRLGEKVKQAGAAYQEWASSNDPASERGNRKKS